MNYDNYKTLIDDILQNQSPEDPYHKDIYFNFTKLNRARMRRWDKQLVLTDLIVTSLKAISKPQHWIIITEPWCGDAAHIIPFLMKMAEINVLISYEIQLRDTEPFLINHYLNDGTKGIPKFIVRDEQGIDLFFWGPRPHAAAEIMRNMEESQADFEKIKEALQNWYNKDKGESLLNELVVLFNQCEKSVAIGAK